MIEYLKNNDIDVNKIKNDNFVFFLAPEFPSKQDLLEISKQINIDFIEFCSFEFNQKPTLFNANSIESLSGEIFEESHKNILIKFFDCDLFIWKPEDNEYYILFGRKEIIQKIKLINIFDYSFEEYMNEPSFSNEQRDFLNKLYISLS